jgi:hypothetical protein
VRLLRWVALALGVLLSAVAVVWLGARFLDGPLGPFPGGPMDGEVVKDAAVDWSFAADRQTLALQTSNPPRSRTVWLVVHDGALYVPSGNARAKQWPHQLAEDPVVLLRIDERLFLRTAVRVTDPSLLTVLWKEVADKYAIEAFEDHESHWIFRMEAFEADG